MNFIKKIVSIFFKKGSLAAVIFLLLCFILLIEFQTGSLRSRRLKTFYSSFYYLLGNFNFLKYQIESNKRNEVLHLTGNIVVSGEIQKDNFITAFYSLTKTLEDFYVVRVSSYDNFLYLRLYQNKKPVFIFSARFSEKISKHKVAIVIDDVGYNETYLSEFLKSRIAFTFAVLPMEKRTKECIEELKKQGQHYLLHMPMEPYDFFNKNPGKMALLKDMEIKEIESKLERAIKSVDGCVGMNNHMGSRFTEDKEKMEIVMRKLKANNMFFLDSRTTQNSNCYSAAVYTGVRFLENKIFLDGSADYEAIKKQFIKLLAYAKRHDRVVAIGHVRSPSILQIMTEMEAEFNKNNIEFVYLWELFS